MNNSWNVVFYYNRQFMLLVHFGLFQISLTFHQLELQLNYLGKTHCHYIHFQCKSLTDDFTLLWIYCATGGISSCHFVSGNFGMFFYLYTALAWVVHYQIHDHKSQFILVLFFPSMPSSISSTTTFEQTISKVTISHNEALIFLYMPPIQQ